MSIKACKFRHDDSHLQKIEKLKIRTQFLQIWKINKLQQRK